MYPVNAGGFTDWSSLKSLYSFRNDLHFVVCIAWPSSWITWSLYVTDVLFFKLIQVIKDKTYKMWEFLRSFRPSVVVFNMTWSSFGISGNLWESVHQISDHFYHYHHHHLLIIHYEIVFFTNLIIATANLILFLFDELCCSRALMYKYEKPNWIK